MYYTDINFNLKSPVRNIKAGVELYSAPDVLENIFLDTGKLKEFTVERVGESGKFFGFGICHKANIKMLYDEEPKAGKLAEIYFYSPNDASESFKPYPALKITEIHKDENSGEISITAYDALNAAAAHSVAELGLGNNYSIEDVAVACADLLGLTFYFNGTDNIAFLTEYEQGANFSGNETIKEVLDDIAEATQTIYFINNKEELVFKRLADADNLVIKKADYTTLESGENRRLSTLTHATELGDNITATTGSIGTTQYIRDNAFYELRNDVDILLEDALSQTVGDMTIAQFELKWRGNFLAEIGDLLEIQDKDGGYLLSYLLDDVITYNGALEEATRWHYEEQEGETASNPSSLGEVLNKTFARVDKANREIEILASETSANAENIAQIMLDTNSINLSVEEIKNSTTEAITNANEDIAILKNSVATQITSEDVSIAIKSELANGVDKVTTATGFTFNDEGLKVTKSNSEMSTQITEDGMVVYKNNEAVLTANNVGVDAKNLHATTYLIVGNNSRFEDYGSNRTGCFWIGG